MATRQFCSLDVLCLLCWGLNVILLLVTGERFFWQFHWILTAFVEAEAKELVGIAQGKKIN